MVRTISWTVKRTINHSLGKMKKLEESFVNIFTNCESFSQNVDQFVNPDFIAQNFHFLWTFVRPVNKSTNGRSIHRMTFRTQDLFCFYGIFAVVKCYTVFIKITQHFWKVIRCNDLGKKVSHLVIKPSPQSQKLKIIALNYIYYQHQNSNRELFIHIWECPWIC